MSRLVLLIFVSIPLFAFSQSDIPVYKKLSLGVSFEVNYVNRFLRHDQSLKYVQGFPDINGVGKMGGVVGLNLDYTLTPDISLGTGLLFSDRGYATKMTELIWVSPDEAYPTHSKTVFTSYFFEIPLKVKYNFHIANVGMYVTGGPSIGQLIYSKTSVFTYFRDTREKAVSNKIGDGYTNNVLSFHIGVGFDVPISHRFRVSIEPLYRQTLTSLSHHSESKRYFHSFGLNTNLFLRFKKKTYGINRSEY